MRRGAAARRWKLLAAVALLASAVSAAATAGESGADIAHHGTSTGVIPCMACHGERLEGRAAIGAPALAGLSKRQTLAALKAIAAGKQGDNFVMRREARLLTLAQRRKVAAFLAGLPKATKSAS
jgi:cytochrome c553